MEQEKTLKGTRWQPSHAEQSWAELRTDRTYTKVSVEAEDEIVIAGKKTPIVPQSMMNMQTCKPFPGHNISFYIFFGRTAVLSSSLHLPAHFHTPSAALPSQLCCLSECAVQDHGYDLDWNKKNPFCPFQQILRRKQQVRKTQNVKLHTLKIAKYPQKVWFVSKCFILADTIHLCLAALTNYCLQTGSTDAARAKPAPQSMLSKQQHNRKHSSMENVHWQTFSAFNCALFNWYYS